MGANLDPKCVHYGGMVETSEHLFIQCLYVRQLWKRLMDWLQWPTHSSLTIQQMQLTIQQTNRRGIKAQILKHLFIETIHMLSGFIEMQESLKMFVGIELMLKKILLVSVMLEHQLSLVVSWIIITFLCNHSYS